MTDIPSDYRIVETAGRMQPYTLWLRTKRGSYVTGWKGWETVWFAETRDEAERKAREGYGKMKV